MDLWKYSSCYHACLSGPMVKSIPPEFTLNQKMDIWLFKNGVQTTVRTMVFKAAWLVSAHVPSSHHTNLSPLPTPPHQKKKCYADIMCLEQWWVQYALFWNDEFSASPGGTFSQRQKCIRAAEKIHLYNLAPLLWNFQLYISNYGCQLMDSEKTCWSPPPVFCLFVISSVRMIIAHLHN